MCSSSGTIWQHFPGNTRLPLWKPFLTEKNGHGHLFRIPRSQVVKSMLLQTDHTHIHTSLCPRDMHNAPLHTRSAVAIRAALSELGGVHSLPAWLFPLGPTWGSSGGNQSVIAIPAANGIKTWGFRNILIVLQWDVPRWPSWQNPLSYGS